MVAAVLCDVTLHNLVDFKNISEQGIASIFRTDLYSDIGGYIYFSRTTVNIYQITPRHIPFIN
jgi:hypothetical protein